MPAFFYLEKIMNDKIINLHPEKPVASASHQVLRLKPPVPGECCEKCFYFVHAEDGKTGSCHERSPQVVVIPQMNAMRQPVITVNGMFSPVSLDSWCGQFLDYETEMSETPE